MLIQHDYNDTQETETGGISTVSDMDVSCFYYREVDESNDIDMSRTVKYRSQPAIFINSSIYLYLPKTPVLNTFNLNISQYVPIVGILNLTKNEIQNILISLSFNCEMLTWTQYCTYCYVFFL